MKVIFDVVDDHFYAKLRAWFEDETLLDVIFPVCEPFKILERHHCDPCGAR